MGRRRQPTFVSEGRPHVYARDTGREENTESENDDLLGSSSTRYSTGGFVERWARRASMSGLARPLLPRSVQDVTDSEYPPISDSSDNDSLTSKPSTRRSSVDSSIDDVCMPLEQLEDLPATQWPELTVLDEFAEREKQEFAEFQAAELVLQGLEPERANGRLRPRPQVPWRRREEDADTKAARSFRFTYFRDDLPATIHSQTLSGLLTGDRTWNDLFSVENVDLSSSQTSKPREPSKSPAMHDGRDSPPPRALYPIDKGPQRAPTPLSLHPREATPQTTTSERGPFWLDVMCPTEEEMRVLAKTFGIHPLTSEDILLQETREKVELFRNYYFTSFASYDVNWRSRRRRGTRRSTSSTSSSSSSGPRTRHDKLRPLAMYTIVFHKGIITVHYAPTPHTINVRRRIRLLKSYLDLSSDWICYALIDDITDGFAPVMAALEEDVNAVEDGILNMHASEEESEVESVRTRVSSSGTTSTGHKEWKRRGHMLRDIGNSRKRVTSMLGLLCNKADVIRGFSKRVTEQWMGESRMEIAMYLSDIQDHLVTMVQSLNHYEKSLARAHSNYLAQINIDMTKTNNDMNDVLSKLSVLGTLVLPMNLVTGLWGMNVVVPGQYRENDLRWFIGLLCFMALFAAVSYYVIRRFL